MKPENNSHKAKIAVMAQSYGVPVAEFLDATRWLLNKKCPFCQLWQTMTN
jgi:hypothetical protein